MSKYYDGVKLLSLKDLMAKTLKFTFALQIEQAEKQFILIDMLLKNF